MRRRVALWLQGVLTHARDEEAREARARRVVRANNFTQQTNALDVDKHMLVIIVTTTLIILIRRS